MTLTQAIRQLRPNGAGNCEKMLMKKQMRSATKYLGTETSDFRADENATKAMQYNPKKNFMARIQQEEHVREAKDLTKINWQDEVRILDDYV